MNYHHLTSSNPLFFSRMANWRARDDGKCRRVRGMVLWCHDILVRHPALAHSRRRRNPRRGSASPKAVGEEGLRSSAPTTPSDRRGGGRTRPRTDGDPSRSVRERNGGSASRGGAPALPINAVSEQRVEGYRMDRGKNGLELI